jgi:[calcium/calmodulin-dependent protein kinase] kinase
MAPQETLNARSEYTNSEDDGTAQHRINQYIIKQEIGRGSFGAVHLAVDQYGKEYVMPLIESRRILMLSWFLIQLKGPEWKC